VPEGNGNYDWRERMRRLEESVARNWEEHDRIFQAVETLRDSNIRLHEDVANLVEAIRKLIDRIPPESLR
jgi:coenzyme F420-reducing hydrogenase delta subunit